MSVGWVLAAVALAIAVVLFAVSRFRRHDDDVDLGSVSHQWIAEQRYGQGHDLRR